MFWIYVLHAPLCTETLSLSYRNFMNKLLLTPVVFKLVEKSEALALCLFELQNCLLSLDAVSEVINKCLTVHTDK